jgi:uncharacterized protein YecT (DUF1311 family)
MNKLIFFSTILLSLNITSFAQTQAEMNSTAGKSYAAADKELNLIYQSILKEYSHDTIFIKNLKTAQSLWIKLRDADLNVIYVPDRGYGSIQSMCRSGILEKFTKDRILFLKTWAEGIEEGDACLGTRKIKH